MSSINNTITGVSNWTDATFRKKANQVPWNEISGQPDFNLSNNSIEFAGVALGAAGLLFGGYAILNNQGQLVGDLANVGSTLKLVADGSTYSKIPNAQFGDYVPDTFDLSEVGSMSAKLAEFLNVKATSLKIGTTSLTLSNNQVSSQMEQRVI
jgi:Leucine-rich repeat (LRR) protein